VLTRLDYGNATLFGLPAYLLNRLQSVLNASARSVAGLRQSAHITDALASFHWLRAAEGIKFKLAVIVYRALHSTAPLGHAVTRCVYFQPPRCPPITPSYCRRVGERSFASAGPILWNSLPDDITTAQSLPAFRRKLTTISAIIPGHYTVVSDCFRHGGPSSYFLL